MFDVTVGLTTHKEKNMSFARQSFIDLIRQDFIDPEIKKNCIEESRKMIAKGQTNRAFDHFPHLVPDHVLKDILKNFQQILAQIKPNNEFTLNETIQKRVRNLELNLASRGCFELLDAEGRLKDEFLEELQWTDLKDKIDGCEIVCSYVHSIHQQLMDQLLVSIKKHCDAYKSLLHYVNPNYGDWVIEQMKKSNYSYDDTYYEKAARSNFDKILYFPSEKPLETLGIVAGIAGFAAIGITLFTSFLASTNKEKETSKPAEPFNRPKM